ncbi:heterokaryon incompatibility protein-domain-containing protein [Cercophora newfieldiana]|uniref:Heterokaryon incompatibility protein-domain-containing protein n=1 Tax=Cercophora newfieldiana TaxID=92897 RepID=A0AA40CV18_9PEZI|nr:heterokaryon incompatibility protein-domain-containing protein [Cercophora newfieldiana]
MRRFFSKKLTEAFQSSQRGSSVEPGSSSDSWRAGLCPPCSILSNVPKALAQWDKGWQFDRKNPIIRRRDRWPGLPNLASSGRAGCGFCRLVHQGFHVRGESGPRDRDSSSPYTGDVDIRVLMIMARDHRILGIYVEITGPNTLWERPLSVASISFIPSCSNPLGKGMFFQNPAQTQVLTAKNVAFLRKSILACLSNCHPPRAADFIPSRLLDLQSVPLDGTLRLVITSELAPAESQAIRYAALSYCWGEAADASTQSVTTARNIHERRRSIACGTLSPVIRDAVSACVSLQIRHLWIDCLCILQGSESSARADWEAESERMTDIFRGSFLTICTPSSTSCNQGFLLRDPQPSIKITTSSSLLPSSPNLEYNITQLSRNLCFSHFDRYYAYERDYSESRWSERAWVLQEDRFSTRKVIFGPSLLHFRCPNGSHCENGVSSHTEADEFQDGAALGNLTFTSFNVAVSNFATRAITNSNDRLPAMAGFARDVFLKTGSDYVAGLWRKNIHRDLMFGVQETTATMEQRIAELRSRGCAPSSVPSWSWLAHTLPLNQSRRVISYSVFPDKAEYEGIWFNIRRKGKSQFGDIEFASIFLRTHMVAMPFITDSVTGSILDFPLHPGLSYSDERDPDRPYALNYTFDIDFHHRFLPYQYGQGMELALVGSEDDFNFYGLVLLPAGMPGRYYRIGRFRFAEGYHGRQSLLAKFPWNIKTVEVL